MLVTVQFPFADLRPFIADSTHRLPTPAWPSPRPGTDFIRLLGQVRHRLLGGVKDWSGEHVFCSASRAIRFGTEFSNGKLGGTRRRHGAFRRFFADGEGLARIEVGVDFRGGEAWTQKELLAALHDVVSQPVVVGRGDRKVLTKLLNAGNPLARLTLDATTSRKAPAGFNPENWWIVPAEQMIFVEYSLEREAIPVPPKFRVLTHPKLGDAHLAYGRMVFFGRPAGVWLYGRTATTDRDFSHRLRIHLLRLHAQREVVKEVLRAVDAGRIQVVRTKPEDSPKHPSNRLQRFLTDTIDRLEKKEHGGLPHSELLLAAEEVQESVSEGETTAILQSISPLRKYVVAAVQRFSEVTGSVGTVVIVEEGGTYQVTDNSQNTNINGSNNVVNQVIAEQIQNAFNTVKQSDASDEMKKRLTELSQLVEQLVKKAPPEVQEKAAMNLEMLTKQATAKKPDRAWYDVSAKGLLEAAEAVAGMATPITSAVKAIAALLI